MKGGYQIIPVGSPALAYVAGEGQVVAGVGKTIANSNMKRQVIRGLNLDGKTYPDFEVVLTADSNGDYVGTMPGYTIKVVVATDTVTFTAQA